jgi:hypothetical protein
MEEDTYETPPVYHWSIDDKREAEREKRRHVVDGALYTAAMEAQFLMGHIVPNPHVAIDRRTIETWSWEEDSVRQALHVPLNTVWEQRVLELEVHGLASFAYGAPPVTHDAAGNAHEIPGWEDMPRDQWGSVSIHPAGVLTLATLYGRPYVRLEESPAVRAHWQMVQRECKARLQAPHDEETWAREYPERALHLKASQEQS